MLAICGGNLPAWVKQLVFDCKFLFPFDLRRRYFYCTASGLARALQHLQQQQTAEGATSSTADRELRVSRIQRSKACLCPCPAPLALLPVLYALLASQHLARALSCQAACARLTQQGALLVSERLASRDGFTGADSARPQLSQRCVCRSASPASASWSRPTR